jgi:hypothetical protein
LFTVRFFVLLPVEGVRLGTSTTQVQASTHDTANLLDLEW